MDEIKLLEERRDFAVRQLEKEMSNAETFSAVGIFKAEIREIERLYGLAIKGLTLTARLAEREEAGDRLANSIEWSIEKSPKQKEALAAWREGK